MTEYGLLPKESATQTIKKKIISSPPANSSKNKIPDTKGSLKSSNKRKNDDDLSHSGSDDELVLANIKSKKQKKY